MALTAQNKKTPTLHEKKRHGQHHETHKKHYAKHYWPYLPLLAIVSAGLLLSSTLSRHQAVLGYATNISPVTLLQDTNVDRAGAKEGALTLNGQLAKAAQSKAEDMAKRNYWSHQTPNGTEPWQFVTDAGYAYQAMGENLAYGFANSDTTIAAWMSSPEHRANLLNTDYKEVGFGIANAPTYQGDKEQTIVVAMYAEPAAAGANVAAVVGNPSVTDTPTPSTGSASLADAQAVSRVQIWTDGSLPWATSALVMLAVLSTIAIFFKHGLHWRRMLVKGEQFIVHHRILDYGFVLTGILGYILTRSAGAIH